MSSFLSLLLTAFLSQAEAAPPKNLVVNGTFEKGNGAPAGWHVRLTDYMPFTIRSVDKRRRCYFYICGCGEYLGTFKPWGGLACPRCKGFMGAEESGALYLNNHKLVSLDKGQKGRGIKFTLPPAIGNNQGVRVFSRMFRVKRGWGYILNFDTKAKGAHPRVFVETYRYPKDADDGPPTLRSEDIMDLQLLCEMLSTEGRKQEPGPSKGVWERLPTEIQSLVAKTVDADEISEEDENRMLKGLNAVLAKADFYDPAHFAGMELHDKIRRFLKRKEPAPSTEEIQWINRHLMSASFREAVTNTPEDPDGCRGIDISGVKRNVEKKYRAHVNCEGVGMTWKHYTKEMVAPKAYPFDWMTVKLYAYMPGEAWFDNVSVRPMTKKEYADYFVKNPRYKDRRFKF